MNVSAHPHRFTAEDFMSYGDRLDWASHLRRVGLIRAERHATSVRLWYSAPYHPEVREWAAKEAECSPWLTFALSRIPSGVLTVTITAPPGACTVTDELFAELSGLA
jgi:hypothetical protein